MLYPIAAVLMLSTFGCATGQVGESSSGSETAIPQNSPLAKIRKGMGLNQVMTILGPPNDEDSHVTGKAFIPGYFGSDFARTVLYYEGLGKVYMGSGAAGGPSVVDVVYDPTEDGFKGDFGSKQDVRAKTQTAQHTTKPLNSSFRGLWRGNVRQEDVGEYEVIINTKKEPFTIDYPSAGCSGTLVMLGQTGQSVDFTENIVSGTSKCVNNGKIQLVLEGADKAKMNWYYLNGQLGASGTLRQGR
jgi:hypothetical protein